jgi:hypothetical protein
MDQHVEKHNFVDPMKPREENSTFVMIVQLAHALDKDHIQQASVKNHVRYAKAQRYWYTRGTRGKKLS